MQNRLRIALIVAPLVLVAACTDPAKAPAEAALAAANAAVESMKGDTARFAPDALKAAQGSIATAKELLDKKDYKGATAAAEAASARVKESVALAAERKQQISKVWDDLSQTFPTLLAETKAQLAAVGARKKLPAGLDREALANAKDELAGLEKNWEMVVDFAAAGNLTQAVIAGKGIEAKVRKVQASLGKK